MLKNVISYKSGMLCGAKHRILARLYSGTPLIQSPIGQKNLAALWTGHYLCRRGGGGGGGKKNLEKKKFP